MPNLIIIFVSHQFDNHSGCAFTDKFLLHFFFVSDVNMDVGALSSFPHPCFPFFLVKNYPCRKLKRKQN